MRLSLGDILTLAGRLADRPGPDTPRERFRRFLTTWEGTVTDLRSLIEDGQRAPDEQSQRALTDLVVTIGRYLGFSVTYGVYERQNGSIRFDGVWRSPGIARLVLEVRTDRTRPFSPDDLARTIAALPDVEPAVPAEQTAGLCIVVPVHGRRRHSDAPWVDAADGARRVLSLPSVLTLAERVVEGQLTHAQVAGQLLGSGSPASAGELTVRLAEASTNLPQPASHLSLVPKERPPDYWIATMLADGEVTPAQFVDAVIRGRQLLGVSTVGIFPTNAHAGDWVCFFLPGTGVVGHARLAGEIEHSAAPLRGAERYTAVFPLADLEFYDVPHPLDPASATQRLANRVPYGGEGPFLTQLSHADFVGLTARPASRTSDTSPVEI